MEPGTAPYTILVPLTDESTGVLVSRCVTMYTNLPEIKFLLINFEDSHFNPSPTKKERRRQI
jgi:hypothetical protein